MATVSVKELGLANRARPGVNRLLHKVIPCGYWCQVRILRIVTTLAQLRIVSPLRRSLAGVAISSSDGAGCCYRALLVVCSATWCYLRLQLASRDERGAVVRDLTRGRWVVHCGCLRRFSLLLLGGGCLSARVSVFVNCRGCDGLRTECVCAVVVSATSQRAAVRFRTQPRLGS